MCIRDRCDAHTHLTTVEGKLYNQDRVLCQQTHQHDQRNLHIDCLLYTSPDWTNAAREPSLLSERVPDRYGLVRHRSESFRDVYKRQLGTMSNNIYMQIALIMLMGLLAKNAILIVEFALDRRKMGMSITLSLIHI